MKLYSPIMVVLTSNKKKRKNTMNIGASHGNRQMQNVNTTKLVAILVEFMLHTERYQKVSLIERQKVPFSMNSLHSL